MKICVIGAGNAGSTMAADLSKKGHQVTLLRTSRTLHNEHFDEIVRTSIISLKNQTGNVEKIRIYGITTEIERALTPETELVVVFVQTVYHKDVIKRIVPFLHKDEIVLFEPGYCSTSYLLQYTNESVISVEAESSPIDCRIISPGVCQELFRNVRNPIGVFPKNKAQYALEKLKSLQYNFVLTSSVIEAGLHNPNLIVHTVGAIMSIPRIEYSKGEYWMYKEVFTPSVWNIVESLDEEKNAVLSKLGIPRLPYLDACKFRNCADLSKDSREVFFDYAQNYSPKGPQVPDSRYITEDVSQGLCLLESLGLMLEVPTPVCSSLINIASASLRVDFRLIGRNLLNLGKEQMSIIIRDSNCNLKKGN